MKLDKQRVTIKLGMSIEDQGEKEYNKTEAVGFFYNRGHFDVLIYEEELDQGGTVRNLITIQPEKTTIKRTGTIAMNQSFLEGKKTETRYQHPYGTFHMETYTDSFTYDSLTETNEGKLLIAYTVKLNGAAERRHVMKLTYKTEDEA